VQIDDTVLKISAILRKARNIKNRLAPINQLPPETLALTATFLVKQRDLINATTVCQQWRTTLLSFPRLWHKAGGSASELEAYLERSGSVPIKVNLSSPHLFASITSHTSRLVALTMCVDDSSDFDRIATHLCHSHPHTTVFGDPHEKPHTTDSGAPFWSPRWPLPASEEIEFERDFVVPCIPSIPPYH
jgi:hypothetical protein